MRNRLFATFLLVTCLVIVSGCTNNASLGPRADSIWGNFSVTYNVVDSSGKNINYSNYSFYSVTGHYTSANNLTGKMGGGGATFNNGTTYSLEKTWPVNPGDYVMFGACDNYGWLNEDLASVQFNPGKAGYWTRVTYDDIKNYTKGSNATMNITMTLSAESGRMITAA